VSAARSQGRALGGLDSKIPAPAQNAVPPAANLESQRNLAGTSPTLGHRGKLCDELSEELPSRRACLRAARASTASVPDATHATRTMRERTTCATAAERITRAKPGATAHAERDSRSVRHQGPTQPEAPSPGVACGLRARSAPAATRRGLIRSGVGVKNENWNWR
jgi:hypothetical protein